METNLLRARSYAEWKAMRRAYRGWISHARDEVQSRKASRKASIQQRRLLNYLKDGESTPANAKSTIAGAVLAKQQRAQQCEDAQRRLQKERREADADILAQQRTLRRQRVERDRQENEKQFQATWTAKKAEADGRYVNH
jgi:hypothetical protein